MKIFLSAYACEPGKGSEPGVGWRWANGLAERVGRLTVLTREDNRQTIDRELAKLPVESPLRRVTFLYHDLCKPLLWAKRKKLLPTIGYYALWQWSVTRKFGALADQFDIVHHLTFCTLLCPGLWRLKHAAYVLGPVGAPQVNPHYLPLFGGKAWVQKMRGWVIHRFPSLPWLRRLLGTAAAVVPANSETRQLLMSHGIAAREVMLDTGAPFTEEVPDARPRVAQPNAIRLMYAGQLEPRKGLELSLRALAKVPIDCDWSFDVFGAGPDRDRLADMSTKLEIEKRVKFHGAVPQTELKKSFHEADAFLFTSVRDTSGGVNLEAMAQGLPIICVAHQGVGDITDETCAERVSQESISETIDDLAAAIVRLALDPVRRLEMGRAAAHRAQTCFSWNAKFDLMVKIYEETSH
ncbi:MAG: glycosyltransferase family 4 protein [Akkermansiaceae bacterium]|nr:glycosyltransferase family 4 protein [Akkermansiaceae bacterium]MDP4721657.1 glycosyltransferase family 4 protein [Akkermansiaceae bacterium]MDP4778829.1 glycosyltransferase family 4 protein [Akkermansiaceae bacterium]MDP4846970.1 glycosyltransferase family 4 protein [Akkermansiaceae bacterium]MDP4997026.1 glycosyltransferase family 4 protein [Akkermansiaceae bacterium]